MKTEIKILIAEHDSNDLELIDRELKKSGINYIAEVVQNERDYVKALKTFIPDIILSDYNFPSFNGPAAFKIREKMVPDTPFIFVSGAIGEEKAVELIKTGVTDYVLKDKLFTLNTKITRALKESKQQQQKKKADEKLLLSEKRLARAQQVAHMGSWELDFATNNIQWSDEVCQIYGLLPCQNKQSLNTTLSFVHPEDIDFVFKSIKDSQECLHRFSIDYRIIRGNGFVRHIYSEGIPEFDSKGKCTGLYGIVHDITEKVLLENKLVQERSRRQSEITEAVLTAQEKERADIGKELYDNLNNILSASKIHIEMAKTDEMNRPWLLEKSSGYIVDVMQKIMKISKTVSRPDIQVGLLNSIKILLDDLATEDPVEIKFFHDNIDENYLNEKLQVTIFRIVQEQVKNIVRHARAGRATISLNSEDNKVILLITDNGQGTNILKENDGVGIRNIKSRAALYNGDVTTTSKPGQGYELKVTLTLNGYMNKSELVKAIPAL